MRSDEAIGGFEYGGLANPGLDPVSYSSAESYGTGLPIELASLSAFPQGSHVDIRWSTAVEQGVASFTIERSRDLRDWSTVATTAARAAEGSGASYRVRDHEDIGGPAYYRLVTNDWDGSTHFSHVIVSDREASPKGKPFRVRHIPGTDYLSIDIGRSTQPRPLALLTGTGHQLGRYSIEPGEKRLQLPLPQHAAGLYVVRVDQQSTRVLVP